MARTNENTKTNNDSVEKVEVLLREISAQLKNSGEWREAITAVENIANFYQIPAKPEKNDLYNLDDEDKCAVIQEWIKQVIEMYSNPPEGNMFRFERTRELLMRLNELIGRVDNNNKPDQIVCDICKVARELGAHKLVKVCESFTEGDENLSTVFCTASEVLAELADETRKMKLKECFAIFCECNGTTIEEMREII